MLNYIVKDMSCEHCVSSVKKAVAACDANASVDVDLSAKTVRIDTTTSDADMQAALRAAGYEPRAAA